MRRKQRGPEVFRITGARRSLAEDVRGRERRYVISMLVRTVSVLLTVALWNVQRPLAVVTLVLGAVLPYVAVVIANAGRENAPSLPDAYLSAPPRDALESAGDAGEAGDGRTPRSGPRTIRQVVREPADTPPAPGPERSGPGDSDSGESDAGPERSGAERAPGHARSERRA
ncbi:DUF3099 domain-containing protein [Streptomyces sp. TRM43335]|uniref:DUF3099 domain-containing protein n=1 Tax=Streptomyces taklimakanensis TaxID=2569853 RepID=A0A6G2B840_9ACTN|nr:DUF3099 domain-containing protein [Streptomyces taklimakanensis]